MSRGEPPIVWFAGVGWDDIPGTDRRLVLAVAERVPVIWVDAPRRGGWTGWWRGGAPAVTEVGDGITRLRAPGLPGFSRWPVRAVTALVQRLTVARHLPRGVRPRAVVVAQPVTVFPRGVPGPKVLFMTDDWIAGAELMGFSRAHLSAVVARNVRGADAVMAVTPPLIDDAQQLGMRADTLSLVLPNGAPVVERIPGRQRRRIAGVVGQLNERTDVDLLRAVADAGIEVRLVGPRKDQDVAFGRRLDALLAHEHVEWTGGVGPTELAGHLAEIGVGLTPYATSGFNRASFPLKTLEYLAAGLSVVSTDLPASRWLATEHVDIATDTASFVSAVQRRLAELPVSQEGERQRVAFAECHGWHRRAEMLLDLVERVRPAPSGGGADAPPDQSRLMR